VKLKPWLALAGAALTGVALGAIAKRD
jgi:hypothetical protein